MSPPAPRTARRPEHPELTRRFLSHLAEEEAALVRMRDCLGQVRDALRHSNSTELEAAFARQLTASQQVGALREGREQLRQECAAQHRTRPEAITLQFLAAHTGAKTRERLLKARDRLRSLTVEIRDLNHRNAALAGHCQQFLHQLLQELTGGVPSAAYGPTGAPRAAACGALIEVRG